MSPIAFLIVVEVVAVAAFFGSLAWLLLGIGVAIVSSLSAASETIEAADQTAAEPSSVEPLVAEPAVSAPRPRTRRRHVPARSRARGLTRVRS